MRTNKYGDPKRLQPDFWTRRNPVSTMLLMMFNFWQCPHCKEVVWLGNVTPRMEIEVYSGEGDPYANWRKPYESVLHEQLAASPFAEQLDGSEFIPPEALPATPAKMALLRLKIAELWKLIVAVTRQRKVSQRQFNRCLDSLLASLDAEHPAQRILKAEGLRQLGRYSMASGLLDGFTGQWERIAAEIADLARQQHKGVVRLAL
jgi:hypothetical protein